jgi:hypothetical protein
LNKRVIFNENLETYSRASLFLMVLGLLLVVFGYSNANYATAFLGLSFGILSGFCFGLIKWNKIALAKISWAIGTPILIFISPIWFSLAQESTVTTYSYLYYGGMLYISWALQDKEESTYRWISIGLFFLGIAFYDRFIVAHFSNGNYERLFSDFGNYLHFKIAQCIHFVSLVYLIHLALLNKSRIEEKLSEQITRLQSFTMNLINSSKSKLLYSGNLTGALEEIVKNAATTMDVSRVSVWELDPEARVIRMVVGYDLRANSFKYGEVLKEEEYPVYFSYLLQEKIVMAPQAATDEKTKEFASFYLPHHQIKSMMDTPFFIDGSFKGILCFEEQREERNWSEIEQLFSMSIGKLISISYYCCHRKEQFDSLVKTTGELKERNKDMEEINSKITHLNRNLRTDLSIKEEDLKSMSEFIDELSFRNAHHVRGPLSRILGLINLYEQDTNEANRTLYIQYINQSAKELDDIIREITVILSRAN